VIIDAHHHFWDPAAREHAWLAGLPALRRRFGPAEFAAAASPEGVTASVLVQVLASTSETEEFLALAALEPGTQPRITGVVGWADLTDPGLADEIARLRGLPGGGRLAGLRHLVQDEPDPGWLARPEVRRGLAIAGRAGLAYDLLVRPVQLPAAIKVVSSLPEVRFVLDHAAKPGIGMHRTEPWSLLISELAGRPNVSCKLSGLVTEAGAGWTAEQIAPFSDWVLDCFGPGRLMFGSDWPVCTLAASYHQVMSLAGRLLDRQLSAAERAAVFGGNAANVYQLADKPGQKISG
jgi:L-fucono-1,5-lactonase